MIDLLLTYFLVASPILLALGAALVTVFDEWEGGKADDI